jgi:hypothetical protein
VTFERTSRAVLFKLEATPPQVAREFISAIIANELVMRESEEARRLMDKAVQKLECD